MHCEGKLKLRSHKKKYCLIEVVTKAKPNNGSKKEMKIKYFDMQCKHFNYDVEF